MVTMKDIAERAGVSRGTVDRVLNNRGRVDAQKAERIRRIAREMGYQPNLAGKGLAARKKRLRLGFCYLDDGKAPFHRKICEGARAYAARLEQYGVTVSFFPMDLKRYVDTGWVEDFVRTQAMDGWAADGLLGETFADALERLGMQDIPLVVFNMDMKRKRRLAYVGCDYEQAGRLACGVAALMTDAQGRVGILSQDHGHIPSSFGRIWGFEQEMKENYPSMRVVARQFADGAMEQLEFLERVQEMVRRHREMNVLYVVNPGDYSVCRAISRAGRMNRIRIITNDLVLEEQREMVKNGQIAAMICQEPEKQGARPLEILFQYLALGIRPEKDWEKTELSILIRQNI